MAKSTAKLDGYTLADRLRNARKKNPINTTEQALFYELVAICNEVEWQEVFTCANDDLFRALKISETTLNNARCKLVQFGLIYYKSGKSKRHYGTYSFSRPLTTSDSDTNAPTNAPTNANDSIKQTETETIIGGSAKAAADQKKFKKDSVAPEENPVASEKSTLFTSCLRLYSDFVQKLTQKNPKLDYDQEAALLRIIDYLTENASPGEIESVVLAEWQRILANWHLLRTWLQQRTRLTDINNELQNILSEIHHANNPQATASSARTNKQSAGAASARGRGSSFADLAGRKRNRGANDQERTEFAEAEHVE